MSNILILGRKMIFSGFRSQLSGFRFQVSLTSATSHQPPATCYLLLARGSAAPQIN
jgi:hypothetical protein